VHWENRIRTEKKVTDLRCFSCSKLKYIPMYTVQLCRFWSETCGARWSTLQLYFFNYGFIIWLSLQKFPNGDWINYFCISNIYTSTFLMNDNYENNTWHKFSTLIRVPLFLPRFPLPITSPSLTWQLDRWILVRIRNSTGIIVIRC